jgi:hypothetical protein
MNLEEGGTELVRADATKNWKGSKRRRGKK